MTIITITIADSYCLRGRHSGKVYRLGDAMEIIVADADTDRREISFSCLQTVSKTYSRKRISRFVYDIPALRQDPPGIASL